MVVELAAKQILDVQTIRWDFPILSRTIHGRPLIYLDNAATSQKPVQVIQALTDFYTTHNANIHRGVHGLAQEVGALCLVDGAQSVPHLPVDVQELDGDFLAFSAHKMLGPTGVGVLYARPGLLESMPPFLGGGSMIREVTWEGSTWNDVPWKFEAGTPNIADVAAFGAAIDYLESLRMEHVRAHERELTAYALEAVASIPGVQLYGPLNPDERGGVVTFNVDGVHPHDVATILDSEGIAIRAGHHCARPLHQWLDVPATVRASFYVYNTPEEVDALVRGISRVKEVFGRVLRHPAE